MSDELERAKELEKRLATLKSNRSNLDTLLERVARVVLPTSLGFQTVYQPGVDLNREVYDSTGQLALPRFAAAMDTLITPQTSTWHQMQAEDPSVAEDDEVVLFLDWLNKQIFRRRSRPETNFAYKNFEVLQSMGAFGTGTMYVQDARPGIRYIPLHLAEHWLDQGIDGTIDTVFWEHEYTIRQVRQRKEWDAKLPDKFKERYKDRPDDKVKVLKVVQPRTDRDARSRKSTDMPYSNTVLLVDAGNDPTILEESGYRTFPFSVARYVTAPREVYGRGPAMDALADINTLQEIRKTMLRRGQLAVDPPWLTQDEIGLSAFSTTPGAILTGWLGPDGKPRAQPLYAAGDPGIAKETLAEIRKAVNDAFLIYLFQVLEQGSDRMTATEVMQRAQEKGAMLAPVGGRLRTEYLGTMIDRELDIYIHAGLLDGVRVPEKLRRSGGRLRVTYDSPLTRQQKAEQAIGILKGYEFAGGVAAFDPSVATELDHRKALKYIFDFNGAPPDVVRTEEDSAAAKDEQAQMVAMQQAVQAAPQLADAAKTAVEANNLAGSAAGVI